MEFLKFEFVNYCLFERKIRHNRLVTHSVLEKFCYSKVNIVAAIRATTNSNFGEERKNYETTFILQVLFPMKISLPY